MATGNSVAHDTADEAADSSAAPAHRVEDVQHGVAEAVMPTGRVSIARRVLPTPPAVPFRTAQLAKLDEALTVASRATGLDFSVYVGDLDKETRQAAENLHASLGERAAANAVLIAVSPGQRVVEVVTGKEAHRRLPDRACKLAVMGMVASFKEGDLAGGLLSGLRTLADHAGRDPHG